MTEPRSTDAPPKRLSILAICKPTASLGEALASFAPAGNWRTDCVYMRPKEKALGDLFLLRFSEQPGAHFLVSRGQVLEAGQEIVPVLEGWRTHAQKNKVSAEGTTYQAFDFVVRHGTLFLNATKSGTVVEVEALGSAAVEAGAARDKKLAAAVQRDSKKLDDLKAAARREGAKLDNLNAAVREGLQRDESLKKRIAQGLEKKSKKDFVRQTKDNQLEQFEVEPDYVEDKPFARGGEGEVFMGEYQGDSVVLKKMSLVGVTATKRQKMLNSFKGELAIMVRLRSPRVAQFYGVVTTDSTFLGLVMEYCPGGSLRDALNTDDEITSDRRRIWVSDVALGMSYLYAQGVEHRDLKALNVLLTGDDRGKVSDFGLSKCEELKTAATSTLGQAGTPAFMAPEFLDENPFSEASDVYSFAIVMWEIWSRQIPWGGLQPMVIMRKVIDKGERPPVPAGMPADLRDLMCRCWADKADDRPTFSEIATLLEGVTPPSSSAPFAAAPGLDETLSGQGQTRSLGSDAFTPSREALANADAPPPPPGSTISAGE